MKTIYFLVFIMIVTDTIILWQ